MDWDIRGDGCHVVPCGFGWVLGSVFLFLASCFDFENRFLLIGVGYMKVGVLGTLQ